MSFLSSVTKGRVETPDLITVYGIAGIGKSTFGSEFPAPLFVGPEQGSSHLDVSRLPPPRSLAEFEAQLRELIEVTHEYKTLVVDSLDWIEPFVWAEICKREGVESIEQVGGGFGKGYIVAQRAWEVLLALFKLLRERKGMHVVLIAHAQVKAFNNPTTGTAYDRYQMKLHARAQNLFIEASDAVLFANYKVFTKGKEGQKQSAFGDGARYMYTEQRPAFDAKNRFGLPPEMKFSYSDYRKARDRGAPERANEILAEIAQLAPPDLKERVDQSVKAANGNPDRLAVILDRLRAIQGEKQ